MPVGTLPLLQRYCYSTYALLTIEEDIKKIFKNKGLDLWFEVKCQDTVLKLGLKETLSNEEVNMCITWLKMTGLINGFTF